MRTQVGQAPIEPWKLVGEPPRGVSRATSLRSLTSMRLTPCPVVLPRSWLASAAAGVTIGVEIKILRRVHAIDATPARWRGDAGSSSPRNDFHTAQYVFDPEGSFEIK